MMKKNAYKGRFRGHGKVLEVHLSGSKKQRKTEEEKGEVNGEKHLRGKNSK